MQFRVLVVNCPRLVIRCFYCGATPAQDPPAGASPWVVLLAVILLPAIACGADPVDPAPPHREIGAYAMQREIQRTLQAEVRYQF